MINVVSDIFGSSPVQPLEEHVGIVCKCADNLKPLFAAAVKRDWVAAERVHAEIERLEHEADDIEKQIRLRLPKSLFMPVPRQNLLELLLVQDKIANRTRDVSGVGLGRHLEIPEPIVDCLVESAQLARKSPRELVERLDTIETETDRRQIAINTQLFGIEESLDSVHTIFCTASSSSQATWRTWRNAWVGGAGTVVGLATFGRHVIATVGKKITHLTPSRGFAAEPAAATTIVIASGTGIPISTTHTLVGAVLGVRLARGIEAIDLRVVANIFVAWVATIPAGAIIAIVFFFLFCAVLP